MSRLRDRLEAVRRRHFVGRTDARDLFQSALQTEDLPFYVLFVHGPGGLGKTALLQEFRRECGDAQVPVLYLDARNVEPTPEMFLQALRQLLDVGPEVVIPDLLASRASNQRHVLMLDTYENLLALDDWLRDVFLPQMPENVLCVLAGRDEPSQSWRRDAGWQVLLRTLALRNLTASESADYLRQRHVPNDQHDTVIGFTHGHPLALSLVADVFDQRSGYRFVPGEAADIIEMLISQLLHKVPGPAHRATLEVCCLVRGTTEALLAEILQIPDSHELFQWLRSLSFIEFGPRGLFPHDLAREVLHSDLRWRNPDWFSDLHRRARRYYTARFGNTQGQEQQRALFDLIYLHRENPMVRPFFEWQTTAGILPDRLGESDQDALQAIVAKHEGTTSAHIAAHWLSRQPDQVLVFRNAQGQPAGFLTLTDLTQAEAQDLQLDPGVRSVYTYLQRRAPLRPGEVATVFRFWMADESYQSVSPVQSLIFTNMVRHYLVTPRLAHTFIVCADPDFWRVVFAYADLARLPEADFTVDGHRYGVYGHDWRVTPPLAWLTLVGERELGVSPEQVISRPAILMLVLSQEEFAEAVKDALQHLHRMDLLRGNPLLESRVVKGHIADHATEEERLAELVRQLRAAVDQLDATPKDRKLYRAVYHTYIQPAPTQEAAAEVLDLPFSTYRRHLKAGIMSVTDILWQLETGAAPGSA